MNKYDRYRMELMRISNNIQFYKHKIALCQASNARIYYEKLLAREAKRFQQLQLEYQRLDLRSSQVTYQERKPVDLEKFLYQGNNGFNQEEANPINQNTTESEIDQMDPINQEDIESELAQPDQPNLSEIDSEPDQSGQPNQGETDWEPDQTDQPNQSEIDSEPEQSNQINQDEMDTEQPTQDGNESVPNEQRVFTIEELSTFNGSGGQPAYVAVNGIVYDVSSEKRWGGGTHFSMVAGKNLTMNFNACHGGNIEVLRNLPKVGIIKQ